MDSSLVTVVTIMVLGGLFGGLVNYYRPKTKDEGAKHLWRSIVLGLGASFLIPLFLNAISSNLLSDLFVEGPKNEDLLVFFGFCSLAAISSRVFIKSVTDKMIGDFEESVKVVKEAAQAVNDAKTEVVAAKGKVEAAKLGVEEARLGVELAQTEVTMVAKEVNILTAKL